MASENWGGKRPGSGRKPMPENLKKKPICYKLSIEEKIAVDAMLKILRSEKKKGGNK